MSGAARTPPDPLDLAARLLARARTGVELVRCLLARGVDRERAEETAEECRRRGWLDDAQYARDWLERELRRCPSGPRRLRAGLLQRGLPPAVAEAAVAEAMALHPEEELARAALGRWLRGRGAPPGAAITPYSGARRDGRAEASQAAGLAGFLARRGFDPDLVRQLVEEAAGRPPQA